MKKVILFAICILIFSCKKDNLWQKNYGMISYLKASNDSLIIENNSIEAGPRTITFFTKNGLLYTIYKLYTYDSVLRQEVGPVEISKDLIILDSYIKLEQEIKNWTDTNLIYPCSVVNYYKIVSKEDTILIQDEFCNFEGFVVLSSVIEDKYLGF